MSDNNNVSPSPAPVVSEEAGRVLSVKLLSTQCGTYSRRVLVPAASSHADVLAALSLPAGTTLLYRENAHRCSELVLLATDSNNSDWRAVVHRATKFNHSEIAVVTEAAHKERKQRVKKYVFGGVAVAVAAVLLGVLVKHLPSCAVRGALWPVLLVVALFGFIGAAVGRKNCKSASRCRPNAKCTRNVNTPPQPQSEAPVEAAAAPVSAVNFREQLQTLFTLGFIDVRRNVQELQKAGGDLNVAVQALLNDSK